MDYCLKCGRMTAERNHYTGLLICYAVGCGWKQGEEPALDELLRAKRSPFPRVKKEK